MCKPNIFQIATEEFAQDGFVSWLLQWADINTAQYNLDLHQVAQDFVRLLLDKAPDFKIAKVEAGRKWAGVIDIWAKVNEDILIIIEDKTGSGQHSNQLSRYKEIAQKWCDANNYQLVCIYLKTGNESLCTLADVKKEGFTVITRKDVLCVLNKLLISNDIFNDFKEHLNAIETETNSFDKFENIVRVRRACEGFFLKLQENISGISGWGYVPNKAGGFHAFWYHWVGILGIGTLHSGIENAFENGGIKLIIKIEEWEEPSIDTLRGVLGELTPFATSNGLIIAKPDKYRVGATSTLAIVPDAFQYDVNGIFDFNGFLATLRKLENTLDNYSKYKATVQ